MPKLKSHSGLKKKVVITKRGKVLRRRASGNHFLQKKRASRKRRYAGLDRLSGKQVKIVRRKMGV